MKCRTRIYSAEEDAFSGSTALAGRMLHSAKEEEEEEQGDECSSVRALPF